MHSDTSYVVGNLDGPDDRIKFHLVVDARTCPHQSDETLRKLLKDGGHELVNKAWFIGVHVMGLYNVLTIEELLIKGAVVLRDCASKLNIVNRGNARTEDREIAKAQGSRMFEVGAGDHLDQVGAMQPPHNFKNRRLDPMKM
jgi:hypothetical protein